MALFPAECGECRGGVRVGLVLIVDYGKTVSGSSKPHSELQLYRKKIIPVSKLNLFFNLNFVCGCFGCVSPYHVETRLAGLELE